MQTIRQPWPCFLSAKKHDHFIERKKTQTHLLAMPAILSRLLSSTSVLACHHGRVLCARKGYVQLLVLLPTSSSLSSCRVLSTSGPHYFGRKKPISIYGHRTVTPSLLSRVFLSVVIFVMSCSLMNLGYLKERHGIVIPILTDLVTTNPVRESQSINWRLNSNF